MENQNDDGVSSGGIRQCIPITPGATVLAGGSLYVPGHQSAIGTALIGIRWFETTDCSGDWLFGWSPYPVDDPVDDWLSVEFELLFAPSIAQSLDLIFWVSKSEATGSFVAYFDDAFVLAPEPGATLFGVAALGAVAICARRRGAR